MCRGQRSYKCSTQFDEYHEVQNKDKKHGDWTDNSCCLSKEAIKKLKDAACESGKGSCKQQGGRGNDGEFMGDTNREKMKASKEMCYSGARGLGVKRGLLLPLLGVWTLWYVILCIDVYSTCLFEHL